MSEQGDSAQEKTEQPTPKRQEKAREDGQTPRSKELNTTAVLLAGTIGLWWFGGYVVSALERIVRFNFELERETLYDPNAMLSHLGESFSEALWSLVPIFITLALAAAIAPAALGGWLFSAKSIAPKLNRLSPLAGFKRMFSVKSLMELAKSVAKVLVVVGVALLTLKLFETQLLNLSRESLEAGLVHSLELSIWAAILICCSTIVIALVDIPFQIWDHTKKLRMSVQDIKDEMKDSEGKPEVKGRIRQLQREMANNRMMAQVPEADVIITNPTHYAVALKYHPDSMQTPILVAKGVDHRAMKIREIARAHKIEQIESPVLARAVYHTTEVDQAIPQGLYLAVAQVLAYIFQLRNWRKGQGERPEYPRQVRVPSDMIFPE